MGENAPMDFMTDLSLKASSLEMKTQEIPTFGKFTLMRRMFKVDKHEKHMMAGYIRCIFSNKNYFFSFCY